MLSWNAVQRISVQKWRCGFCNREVASDQGWTATTYESQYETTVLTLALCPNCELPSILDTKGGTEPQPIYGDDVEHLPEDVATLFAEARKAVGPAPNSAAYACRKILMHVAVAQGAKAGESFAHYVAYLNDHGHTPQGSKDWVDEIRELGNDANHEIRLVDRDEAERVVDFTTLLLRLVYEFPTKSRLSAEARRRKDQGG